jgi:hypothetical protein
MGYSIVARICLRASAVICLLLVCDLAEAQLHVPEPTVNLGDTSFLDADGGPGLLIEEIGDAYHSSFSSVDSIAGLTHVAWLGKRRILNAWYGVEVVGVAAHVNVSNVGNAGGWGDLTFAPLILQWKEQSIGHIRMDQRLAFDFDLPTGDYKQSSGVNLGSHAFAVHPYYAITVFPTNRLETSWRIHYLWNARNNAPYLPSGAHTEQAGQAIHFNATLGYKLPHNFWVGANGYYLKQITAPQIDGVSLLGSPERVGAIGPGAMWHSGRCFLYANAYHELGAENRPQGERVVLRMEWILGKEAGPN